MLSIVLPTFNRLQYLRNSLVALITQDAPIPVEILVVDSGNDNTAQMIFDEFPSVKYIHAGEEKNRALLRNKGAEAARGSFILFMDNDMIAPQGYLEGHIQRLQERDNRVVLGRRLSLDDFSDELMELFPNNYETVVSRLPWIDDVRSQDILETGGDFSTLAHPWRFCYSHGLSLSRELFLKAGGFDEQFGLNWGFEDVELGYRLALSGAEFSLLEGLDVFHQPHDEQSAGNDDQADINRIIFRNKHHSGAAELVSCFGPNIGIVLTDSEKAAMEYPNDFLPPDDAEEDLVLGCFLPRGSENSFPGAALGVFLPPDIKPRSIRIIRGFFRLPHVIQCSILNLAFELVPELTVDSLTPESFTELSSLMELLGIEATLKEAEDRIRIENAKRKMNRFFNVILPGFSQPEQRDFAIHLALEMLNRNFFPVITDLEGKSDFSREENILPQETEKMLNRQKPGIYCPLGGRFTVAENELHALDLESPPQGSIIFESRGLSRADYMFQWDYSPPGSASLAAESIALLSAWFGFKDVLSCPAQGKKSAKRNHILVYMMNGYHEDNLPSILDAFQELLKKNKDLRLLIKIPAFQYASENAYPMHNRTSKVMNLEDKQRKYDYDVYSLKEAVRFRKISYAVEIMDKPLSREDRIEQYNLCRAVLFLSCSSLVFVNAFEALAAGIPIVLHDNKILPDILKSHRGIHVIDSKERDYSDFVNQSFHEETFGYLAFEAVSSSIINVIQNIDSERAYVDYGFFYNSLDPSARKLFDKLLNAGWTEEQDLIEESDNVVCDYTGI